MGIYRCKQCGTLAEYAYMPGMQPVPCIKCLKPVKVFDTVYFVNKLLDQYRQQRQVCETLSTQLSTAEQNLKYIIGEQPTETFDVTMQANNPPKVTDNTYDLAWPKLTSTYPVRADGGIDYEGIFLRNNGLWFNIMRNQLIY